MTKLELMNLIKEYNDDSVINIYNTSNYHNYNIQYIRDLFDYDNGQQIISIEISDLGGNDDT